jgi:Zn-dependent M28 family amino/carboxypeptidase
VRWKRRGLSSAAPEARDDQGIRVNVDSLRALRPARADSIFNGADDDGSGSVALLAIAEALSSARPKPDRSVLLVWHTGEELGNQGSTWFTDHPTVPLDSVVAQLNLDMIGRGGAADIVGGGPRYLQVIGSRSISHELGDLIDRVNAESGAGLHIDYQFASPADPRDYYFRSDHASYARHCVPIAFFTTGEHADYHQVTDEPQYIDYAHLAAVTRFVYDVAMRLANAPARPAIDSQRSDTKARCRQ